MAELNKDLKKVYEVLGILSYFKLIKIEKDTTDKDYDSFKSSFGEEYFKKVIDANKANYIQLRDNNYNILTNLRIKMDSIKEYGIDKLEDYDDLNIQILLQELRLMDWLDDAIKDIMPSETGYETIINNASGEVFNKLIKLEFLNMTSRDQDRKAMLERVKEIKEISKSIWNS